jgi:hypothetical protein
MPLQIKANYASGDTVMTLAISQSPQHYEYLLSQEPMSITVDPNKWTILRSTIVGINEEDPGSEVSPLIEAGSTIGRVIQVRLADDQLIRVFDVSGRQVYRSTSRVLDFAPDRDGVYYLQIGENVRKFVIIR